MLLNPSFVPMQTLLDVLKQSRAVVMSEAEDGVDDSVLDLLCGLVGESDGENGFNVVVVLDDHQDVVFDEGVSLARTS